MRFALEARPRRAVHALGVDRGAGPLRDLGDIRDVVAVGVRDEDRVRVEVVRLLHGGRVAVDERVDQDPVAIGFEMEGAMTDPIELNHCVAAP